MQRTWVLVLTVTLTCGATRTPSRADEPDPKLAQQGFNFLKKYCHACHGQEIKKPPLEVLNRDLLLVKSKPGKIYLVPGKPDESYLWKRVAEDAMPPDEVENRPTEEEKKAFKAWIEAGAPFPAVAQRSFKSEQDLLTDLDKHLNKIDRQDRKFQRYFTLTHLSNNRSVTDFDLRVYRAALSKLVNSLSWENSVVVPQAIDKEQTIYHIDLRDLGWHQQTGKPDLWREILKLYPYGLTHSEDKNKALRELADAVYERADTDIPYVRADWFITTASQPPLYHTILQLPKTDGELEKKLNVNVQDNFRSERLVRAGLTTSGVSRHNRLIERHPALYGAYWKSYDFQSSGGNGNLVRLPLGPDFKDHPFPQQAFKQAGGEIIFNLPNGLQGYLLVDKEGKRINDGPIEIVRDDRETSGSPKVVNGLSCMSCHKSGLVSGFQDVIREGSAVGGQARIKVQQLYAEPERMKRLVEEDEQRFLLALERATGRFLQVAEDKEKKLSTFPDPIGAIARQYLKDLTLEDVSSELGYEDPRRLRTLIQTVPRLQALGLGPLVGGAKIKRELWDFRDFGSLFQQVARACELGTPVHVEN